MDLASFFPFNENNLFIIQKLEEVFPVKQDTKKVEVTLKIKIRASVEDIIENDKEAVKFLIEDDLQELGYEVDNIEVLN